MNLPQTGIKYFFWSILIFSLNGHALELKDPTPALLFQAVPETEYIADFSGWSCDNVHVNTPPALPTITTCYPEIPSETDYLHIPDPAVSVDNVRIRKTIASITPGRYTFTITASGPGVVWTRISDTGNWNNGYVYDNRSLSDSDVFRTYSIDFEMPSGTTYMDIVIQSSTSGKGIKIKSLGVAPSNSFTFVNKNATYPGVWSEVGTPSFDAGYASLHMGGSGEGIERSDVVLQAQQYILTATGKDVTVSVSGEDVTGDALDLDSADPDPYQIITVTEAGSYTLEIINNGSDGYIKGVNLKPILDVTTEEETTFTLPPNDDYVISLVAGSGSANLQLQQDSVEVFNQSFEGPATKRYYFKSGSDVENPVVVTSISNITDIRIERGPLHYDTPLADLGVSSLRGWTYAPRETHSLYPDNTINIDDMIAMGANFARMTVPYPATENDLDSFAAVVKTACDRGMYVSIVAGASFDTSWQEANLQEKLANYWMSIAEKMKVEKLLIGDKNCVVGYDLVNEPADTTASSMGDKVPLDENGVPWRDMAQKIVNDIRKIDDKTWIVYEPGFGGGALGFDYMKPLADAKVIYSVHAYPTLAYTLQNQPNSAEGNDEDVGLKISYPSGLTPATVDENMGAVDLFEAKNQVPIYIGEFNAVKWAAGAPAWLDKVSSIINDRDWMWTAHGWREWHGWGVGLNDAYFKGIINSGQHLDAGLHQVSGRACAVAKGLHNDPSYSYVASDSAWTTSSDCDDDGEPDTSDNCPFIANGTQTNSDTDLKGGDVCDADDDNDNMPDVWEDSYGLDPLDNGDADDDSDEDNLSHFQEYTKGTNPLLDDTDADTVNDDTDNCPLIENTDQSDNDSDDVGDVCDPDNDDDDNLNYADNCTLVINQQQLDFDDDGYGNACDGDMDNDDDVDATDFKQMVTAYGRWIPFNMSGFDSFIPFIDINVSELNQSTVGLWMKDTDYQPGPSGTR